MRLRLLRNATLRLSYAGQEILIDPCFGAKGSLPSFVGIVPNPTVELPTDSDAILSTVDITLISHLHIDHFDPAAEAALPKDMTIFCQPENLEEIRDKGFTAVTVLPEKTDWNGVSFKRTIGQHGTGELLVQAGPVMGFLRNGVPTQCARRAYALLGWRHGTHP